MCNLTLTADYLTEKLEELGFIIMSERNGEGLPLVAFRFPNADEKGGRADRHYDEFSLAYSLRSRSWVVPAYTMAPNTDKMKMLRVVVREDFSKSRCDMLLQDVKLCCDLLEKTDRESMKLHQDHVDEHVTSAGKAKQKRHNNQNHKKFKVSQQQSRPPPQWHEISRKLTLVQQDEKHSLQGKTGKTHAVC